MKLPRRENNVLRYRLGADEMTDWRFYEDMFGEFIATFILIFIGIGAAIPWQNYITFAMQIGLAMGIAAVTVIDIFAHRSGGLANPAVSLSFLASGHISVLRCLFYIIAQLIGGIIAAGLFKLLLPEENEELGETLVNKDVYTGNAFVMEFFATLLFILVWHACWDPFRAETKPAAATIIGFTYTACHGFTREFSGASMNPAKSFGPAVIMNNFTHHWVHWTGPIVAGILSGLFYRVVFMKYPSEKVVEKRIKKQKKTRV